MGSILSNNPLPPSQAQPQQQLPGLLQNLQQVANKIIPQFLHAPDKMSLFNQVLNGIPGAQDVYQKVVQNGGDPRKLVMDQLAAQSQQAMSQQIESFINGLADQFK